MSCDRTIGPYPCCSVVQGDCLELMRELPDGCVDAVITDPPYSSGGLHIADKRMEASDKYTSAGHFSEQKAYPDFFGDSCDQFSWFVNARAWCAEAYRCTTPGGHLYVFADWRQIGVSTTALQAGFWQYRGLVVWDKGNLARSPYPGLWRHGAEFIAWATKGKPWTVTGGAWVEGVAPVHSVIQAAIPRDKLHMTEKPVELVNVIGSAATPDEGLIFDPYSGGGTTLVAAKKLGRHFLGFEISPEYCEIARDRLARIDAQPSLFEPKPEQLELGSMPTYKERR